MSTVESVLLKTCGTVDFKGQKSDLFKIFEKSELIRLLL